MATFSFTMRKPPGCGDVVLRVERNNGAAPSACLRLEGKELPPSLSAVASALRERRSLEGVESMIERPDGTRRLVADHADPLFDATGNCIGVVNVQLDVTPAA